MSRAWKLVVTAVVCIVLADLASAQDVKPVFTAKDRELIETYYNRLTGTLAPGSMDRSPFSLGIEKALIKGSHVPMQLEKDLLPLPAKLESQLSGITGEYGRYKLGRHIVLVRKADLLIGDILKDVAVKDASK